ncbi:MAG: DUF2313 domain-containing protein [Oscillospiraceae bacterium]|nr:DUF2313 domain-containing protein [Oscillospiraceae bacterium]MCD7933779.1 DUF2313 domain-containing protein [Oscillospiraceae bacterium]
MDYAKELRELLRPLGIYDVDGGVSSAELSAIGAQMTAIWEALTDAEAEMQPLTACGSGLASWEALLPFVPAFVTTEGRRQAIAALLRIDSASFTVAAINDTIAGCGIPAVVEEAETAMTVYVSFPGQRGEPDRLEALQARIAQIIPCHLAIEYVFVFVTWEELEALFGTWEEIEAAGGSWRVLQRAGGDGA